MAYDPLRLAEVVERQVAEERNGVVYRRYWRFRGGRWYGGIATADVVGCNLRCGVCWAWRYAFRTDVGQLYAPAEVAERLASIARPRGYRYVRLSGGEPTIARRHLLAVIGEVPSDLIFILETNGLLIDEEYARELARFPNLVVRVSIKGATPEEFAKITLADGRYFYRQLDAIRALIAAGMRPCEDVYPAAMLGLTPEGGERALQEELAKIDERLAGCIDEEYVILYPHVVDLMRSRRLRPVRAVTPDGVPASMI